ncbi:MAG: Rrf2 family transcriptional regulator [Crocinitomicaceae bacterium]|nr:Rrf2 family transcriptional regulator [Crocinitomicaceae bacterium]
MFFSKSCEYALKATMYLAKQGDNKRVGIKVIARDLNLPADYLNKVLQILVKHKLVLSSKGRYGGFYLTKNELNKSLLKIVKAIDGKDIFNRCGMGIENCSGEKPCPLHNDIKAYRDNILFVLSNKSVASTTSQINNGVTFLSKKVQM